MLARLTLGLAVALLGGLVGCEDSEAPAVFVPEEPLATHPLMAFGSGFFGAPFPGEHRRQPGGRPDVSGFPDPRQNELLGRVLGVLRRDADGFGLTSAIFFPMSGAVDPSSLPGLSGSIEPGAAAFLIDIDPSSPEAGRRRPVEAQFRADGGPFGAPNLLSMLPLQGLPLRPSTLYAAVLTRGVRDGAGQPLTPPPALRQLLRRQRPEGLRQVTFERYTAAIDALAGRGVPASTIAGLTVFVTGDPGREMGEFYAHATSRPLPSPSALGPREVFERYCVYEGTVPMPVYQGGVPPYSERGGAWARGADLRPSVQRDEVARVVVTIPRDAMPGAGYPTVIFSRTGGGGERPLVDRGRRAKPGGDAVEPGTGPALAFAEAGWAGISVDGPHGGLRNVTKGDEQFLMFNVANPEGLRDNVRQSALELALTARVLGQIEIDVGQCPGAGAQGKARLDEGRVALMGHSMGATIAPLALAVEPRLGAGLLSGAGGSWIENIIHKKKPLAVKGFMKVLLGASGYELHPHDPALSLFQWAGEPADPPVYGRTLTEKSPRHFLMMQGMVDHYILPPIANATSLSLGLDLAGEALDEQTPEVAGMTPLRPLLPLSGRKAIALPAGANRGAFTAVVTQHREDGVEDGHEVVFQTPGPRRQYRCFLRGLAQGAPVVPGPGADGDPCPGQP